MPFLRPHCYPQPSTADLLPTSPEQVREAQVAPYKHVLLASSPHTLFPSGPTAASRAQLACSSTHTSHVPHILPLALAGLQHDHQIVTIVAAADCYLSAIRLRPTAANELSGI